MPARKPLMGMTAGFAAALLAGCSAGSSSRLAVRPEAAVATPTTLAVTQVVERTNANAAQVERLRADSGVSIAGGNARPAGLKGYIAIERPHNFKILLRRAFDRPVLDLGSNDQKFWFWSLRGPRAADLRRRVLLRRDDPRRGRLPARLDRRGPRTARHPRIRSRPDPGRAGNRAGHLCAHPPPARRSRRVGPQTDGGEPSERTSDPSYLLCQRSADDPCRRLSFGIRRIHGRRGGLGFEPGHLGSSSLDPEGDPPEADSGSAQPGLAAGGRPDDGRHQTQRDPGQSRLLAR